MLKECLNSFCSFADFVFYLNADICLVTFLTTLIKCSTSQYDDNEDALCFDEEGEEMGYLEMLNGRLACFHCTFQTTTTFFCHKEHKKKVRTSRTHAKENKENGSSNGQNVPLVVELTCFHCYNYY